MSIYIGTSKIKEIYLGTSKIKEVYLGTGKIFGEEPVSEWNLIYQNDAGYEVDAGTSADKTFGQRLNWKSGVQYRYVFTCVITAVTDSNTQISLRDGNNQSIQFISGRNHYVGQTYNRDDVITSSRERSKEIFVAKNYSSAYSLKITGIKIYEHI